MYLRFSRKHLILTAWGECGKVVDKYLVMVGDVSGFEAEGGGEWLDDNVVAE